MALYFLDGNAAKPDVQFALPESADLTPYRRVFSGAIEFNALGTFITFASDALLPRRSGVDNQLVAQLLSLAQSHYGVGDGKDTWVSRVRSALRAHSTPRTLDINQVAKQLHVPARSLSRRLAREGSNFSDLSDAVLYERARALLIRSGATSGHVAAALGYKELSSFFRAFRRWSGGGTPSAYQRENGVNVKPRSNATASRSR